jgi:hypothetical protein
MSPRSYGWELSLGVGYSHQSRLPITQSANDFLNVPKARLLRQFTQETMAQTANVATLIVKRGQEAGHVLAFLFVARR